MRDFDREFRNTRRMALGLFSVVAVLFVAMVAGYAWIGVKLVQYGPEGIASAAGRAVKAFIEASH